MPSGRQISPDAPEADLKRLTGYDVVDNDFESIGKVTAIWADRTSQAAFVGVQTGWLAGKTHVVPAQGATVNDRDEKIRLAYSKSDIKSAPVFEPTEELNYANETEIVNYFRKKGPVLPELRQSVTAKPGSSTSTTTLGAAAATASGMTARHEELSDSLKEANIPLHEEHLKVGKRQVEAGGVRLRKIVRTEKVSQELDLQHEEIVVERVPAADMKVGAKAFQNEEFYIPLRAEEAVIEKETHVREQFHCHKTPKSEHKTISDDVRKEDIEVVKQEELHAEHARP
jgi:uncharacterized protein (TIGR02271 family)